MLIHKTKIKVEFYDTDAMGITWHGNYVKFLEVARCDFLDFIGYNYYQMGLDGYSYPIIKIDLKYIKPARFRDELEIETSLVEFESCLKFRYLIKNVKTGEKIATASTSQAAVKIGNKSLEFQTHQALQDVFRSYIS